MRCAMRHFVEMENFWLFYIFVIFLFVNNVYCADDVDDNINFILLDEKPQKLWWETASFYQIYPRSFKDSNKDGIGDLNGIIDKLSHLKDIGIDATWLSPIFKSPMADFGYDIANFYEIQPEYGTMDDFDRLIKHANELGVKILLDFVPNHSSDENDWFIKSANKEAGYEDFYIWHPGYEDKNNASNRLPPSNWLSVFRGSAWKWHEIRKEFYFHQFLYKQPDLNYRNPKVVDTMKGVLRFWLDRGVSGFRIDAVPHLFEIEKDENGRFKDEPLSGNTNDKDDWSYLWHCYTTNLPETIDMVYQWRKVLDDHYHEHGGEPRVMMTEAYTATDILMKYYGNSTMNGSHVPFNFLMLERIHNTSTSHEYVACIDEWIKNLPNGRTANWVMGNHDNPRVASRLGTDRIDLINMLILTLPGVSINYYGEEIGMTNQWLSWNDTVDPAACNSNPDIYEYFSRDPERTPMQWNGGLNAGFSDGPKTWLPIADNYKKINVELERTIERSHLMVYIDLQRLRKDDILKYGDVKYAALTEQVIAILRKYENDIIVTLVNVGPFEETFNLKDFSDDIPDVLQVIIIGEFSQLKIGEQIKIRNIVMKPKEGFVLRSIKNAKHYYDIIDTTYTK